MPESSFQRGTAASKVASAKEISALPMEGFVRLARKSIANKTTATLVWVLFASVLTAGDLEDLRTTHEARIAAINAGDVAFVAAQQHSLGVGFSPGSPFADHDPNRTLQSMTAEWRKGQERYEFRTFRLIDPQYQVVGSTGVVWGHVLANFKPVDGPQATEYRKTTHVYVKEDGAWKLLVVHTSWIMDTSPR